MGAEQLLALVLAKAATVSLVTRKPIRFALQCPLGRDVNLLVQARRLRPPTCQPSPADRATGSVNDNGRYRTAIDAGKPDQRRMFTTIRDDQVIWPDHGTEQVDTILLTTGYRPALSYLDPAELGNRKEISTVQPGLGYVGLEWQRSFLSATLRDVGRDARYVSTAYYANGDMA